MIKHGHVAAETLFSFTVPENSASCRIDRYIASLFPDYSRSYFQRLIDLGNITINTIRTKKHSTLVSDGDTVTIQFPAERIAEPIHVIDRTSGIKILAETAHFMIIHKPAHLLVHAPSAASNAITVVDWIRHHHAHISEIGATDRPGIIHRLDRETSGILIVTKTDYAHNAIGILFRSRNIHKTYKAIVAGHPPAQGTITVAIGRDPRNRMRMAAFDENMIDAAGKVGSTKVRQAQTHYRVLEYFENASLVEVKPVTGRTHQIRVHMTSIGHPIIGDQLYGKKSSLIERQALHAESLEFDFDGKNYSFIDSFPDDFQQLLSSLRTSIISLQ